MNRLLVERVGNLGSIPAKDIFIFSTASRPAPGPIQTSIDHMSQESANKRESVSCTVRNCVITRPLLRIRSAGYISCETEH